MQRIGVWNTAFLGDALLTLPLLHTLGEAFPQAELHFFVRKGLGSLFAAVPELTSAREFDKRGADGGLQGAFAYGRRLRRESFNCWINAHRSPRSALVALGVGAHKRIGYSSSFLGRLIHTDAVDRSFDKLDEIERLLLLSRPLGITTPVCTPTLTLSNDAEANAQELLPAGDNAPLVGIHPGSTWPTKQWPAESFGELARLAADSGARVVFFGGPGEEQTVEDVVRFSGLDNRSSQLINLAGALDLPALAACIKRLDCCFTNDSGPMHLAWIQRTPLVAFFGPTVRELGFFPRGETSRVLETELFCRPCGLHGPKRCPKGHHRCMRDLTPDMAWAAAKELLSVRLSRKKRTPGRGFA